MRTIKELHFDIEPVEKVYETMEGAARYVEYSLYKGFATLHPDDKLVKHDHLFHSYKYFRNYKISKDPWLYLTAKTNYYYAIGFNMSRLLDKLGIDYKTRLFNEGGLSLEQILLAQIDPATKQILQVGTKKIRNRLIE